MGSTQSDAKAFFLDQLSLSDGSLPDLESRWLSAQGYNGQLDEAWKNFLAENLLPDSLSPYLLGPKGNLGSDPLLELFGATDNGILIDRLAKQAYRDTALTTLVSADGQAVAGLKDRSPGGNNGTQATAASQATYKTGTPPYLSFDGGDSYAFPSDVGKFAGDFAIYAAVEPSSTSSTYSIISKSDINYNTDNKVRCWLFDLLSGKPRLVYSLANGSAVTAVTADAALSAGPHIVGIERSGSAVQLYVDGAPAGSAATLAGTLGDFTADIQMGRFWFGSSSYINYYTGKFYPFLLLNGSSLTDDERATVVSKLGAEL